MARLLLIVLVIAAVAGGGWFFLNYEVQRATPSGWKIVPRAASDGGVRGNVVAPSPAPLRPTIRIASFQLGRFDEAKLANPQVADVLASLSRSSIWWRCRACAAGTGRAGPADRPDQRRQRRTYDFVTCPTQQRDGLEHYSAFVFDCGTIEVDRTTVHFVEDPLGRLPDQAAGRFVSRPWARPRRGVHLHAAERRGRRRSGRGRTRPAGGGISRRATEPAKRRRLHPAGRSGERRPAPGRVEPAVRRRRRCCPACHHRPRHATARQHPVGPPRHVRVHRPGGRRGHAPASSI